MSEASKSQTHVESEKSSLESTPPIASQYDKEKPVRPLSQPEFDTLPVLESSAVPALIGHEAVLESQVDETGLPPRMSTARMVVLAAGMMMTYFVGVSVLLRTELMIRLHRQHQ